MNNQTLRWYPLLFTVILATLLWGLTFYVAWGNFWLKITFSALTLAGLALWLQPDREPLRLDSKALILGLISAIVLYGIFWLGKTTAVILFSFADQQVGAIYDKGQQTSKWLIALLLFFITGPSEEFYWRGYLQRNLVHYLGKWQGWLLATSLYTLVHLWSFNLMLIGAAAVAGAFWGALYHYTKNLMPVIISHAVWSAVIFTVLPIS